MIGHAGRRRQALRWTVLPATDYNCPWRHIGFQTRGTAPRGSRPGFGPECRAVLERCRSGRTGATGNRVGVNRLSRVRIPPSPPPTPIESLPVFKPLNHHRFPPHGLPACIWSRFGEVMRHSLPTIVFPAKAGIQRSVGWIPLPRKGRDDGPAIRPFARN